jgi:hypothetical protein
MGLNGKGNWGGCTIDKCSTFGMNGDIPWQATGMVMGWRSASSADWNGDGITDIGVFRPSTGKWYLDLNGNGQWDGCTIDGCYTFGMNADLPVAGSWRSN